MEASAGEDACLAMPSEQKAEHALSEPANDVYGEQALAELTSGASVEPSPSEPMNNTNAKFSTLEIVKDANASSAASAMAKMDEGKPVLEGEEKVYGNNEKAEDKFEMLKQQQRFKKKKMTAVVCKKKVVYPSKKAKKEKMKMIPDEKKVAITRKKRKKTKKDKVTADANRREMLNGEGRIEEEEQVDNVTKTEAATNEKSERKRQRSKKKKNDKLGDFGEEILADDEKVKKHELANDKKMKPNAVNKVNKKGKRIKPNTLPEDYDDQALTNADKTEASTAQKASKDFKGLIFMCNSKTKQDCYHYSVLGLPANKKNIVDKVYEGMRLFLFDVDLKLLYGIYIAAGPGGYDIEPEAFKSAFPAQVRFHVLRDCLPLEEGKFKAAIKSNYFSKKKFNCQLTREQVKALCKLFCATARESRKRKQRGTYRVADRDSPIAEDQDRKRSKVQGRKRGSSSKRNRNGSRVKGRWRSPSFDGHRIGSSGGRMVRSPLLDGNLFYLGHHGMYGRDAYVSNASPLPPSPLPPLYAAPRLPLTNSLPLSSYGSTLLPSSPLPSYASTVAPHPAPSYGYQKTSNADYYRKDFLSEFHNQPRDPMSELHDHRFSYQEPLPRIEFEYPDLRPKTVEYHDSYSMYRDLAAPREPRFPSALPSGYNPSTCRY